MGQWHYMTRAGEDSGGLHFIRRDAAGHEQTVLDLSVSQHSHLALGQVRPKHDACLDEHLAPNDQSCQALQEESQHVCMRHG